MSLEDTVHEEFKFVFIPADINDPIEERSFSGKETLFKNILLKHFTQSQLDAKGREALKESIKSDVQKNTQGMKISEEHMSLAMEQSNNYQIVPLTLPTKANGFVGINLYIDNVGRLKDLPVNSRASRLATDDIRGDAFLSYTFDDEEEFRRLDATQKEYETLLQNPPSKKGRWDPSQLLNTLQQSQAAGKLVSEAQNASEKKCSNCYKRVESMLRCSRCTRAWYCDATCQRNDWSSHKRVCHKV